MQIGCRLFSILLTLTLACASAHARDMHVSPRGDDANPGTARRPWRTVAKVNATPFSPGDRVLFQGGQIFAGPLELDERHSGSADRPVAFASYGAGRAAIDGGTGRAIAVQGASHLSIAELKLTGAGRKTGSTASGLVIAASNGVAVDRVEVSGFRRSGVEIDGSRNIRLTRVHAHNNGFAGISSGGAASHDLYIGHCLAENNPGDPTVRKNHSGNGIVVGQARGALIEYSEARYNGWDMPWTGNGPVGIWTYQSDRVVHPVLRRPSQPQHGHDGGGFDFDGGITNSACSSTTTHTVTTGAPAT
jgi:hypothetical protein